MLRKKFDSDPWGFAESLLNLPEALSCIEYLIAAVTGVTTVTAVLGAVLGAIL